MAPAGEARWVQDDSLALRHWQAASCSLAGRCHIVRNADFVACVFDGAGSARFGSGSPTKVVASVSCGIAAELASANAELEGLAEARGASLRDPHATLVGAVLSDDGSLLFHICDGAAFATRESTGGEWHAAAISPPHEGTNSTTIFVTLPDWRVNLYVTSVEAFGTLLLMTGGVAPFALDRSQTDAASSFVELLLTMINEQSQNTGAKVLRNLLVYEDVRATKMEIAARITCERQRRSRRRERH